MNLSSFIRDVPDFPKKGIVFKDITPLLQSPEAFLHAVRLMAGPFRDKGVSKVAGIESRGFIFGTALAQAFGAGFVPVRKKGKLPYKTLSESYALEYGTDAVEVHEDAVEQGERVLLVDDLLATGGTAAASVALLRRLGAEIAGATFLIELAFLQGRERIPDVPFHTVLRYD
ncbi:MAG: adenine phosphoribosyltransferase [Acidobacteriota bacterium]|nr:MAG: adenine phosphoribosyltransferase [Acidobacteriota bacterium]